MICQAFDSMILKHAHYFQSMKVQVTADIKGLVAVDHCNEKAGMVILDSWTENSVQAHIKVTNKMCMRTGGLLNEVARYVYDVAGMGLMMGFLRSDNPKAIEFDKKLGFIVEHIVKDGYAVGVDCVILSMTRDQCNYYLIQERAA